MVRTVEHKKMKEKVSISLDSDVLTELQEIAKQRDISLSALFQRIALFYLYEIERRGERKQDQEPEGEP